MRNELKPCPFCGSDAELRRTGVNWVGCTNDECDAETSSGRNGTVHEAIEIWNKRTEPTELEQLRKERDDLKNFVQELSDETISTITTPTGRFGGDEDTNFISDCWVDDAKSLLAKLNEKE